MTLASRLFDPLIHTAEMDPGTAGDTLLPGERAAIVHAVEKRRREFIAGRSCARLAMAELGEPPAPILQGEDRAPIWPPGLVGCITHTDTRCAVAVARVADGFLSLGLDIEPATPIKAELLRIICLPEERAYLDSQPAGERGLLGKLMFSAKECAYKCQYPLSRTFLDFHAMRVYPDLAGGRFVAVFQRDAGPFASGDELHGRLLVDQGYLMTAMTLTDRTACARRPAEAFAA
jgi:4'-phosphopantetheinyl transferase EntD